MNSKVFGIPAIGTFVYDESAHCIVQITHVWEFNDNTIEVSVRSLSPEQFNHTVDIRLIRSLTVKEEVLLRMRRRV